MTKQEKELFKTISKAVKVLPSKIGDSELITWHGLAVLFQVDISTLKAFAQKYSDEPEIQELENLLRYSFFYVSFKNKINAGIELFIKQELPTNQSVNNLKVSKDITDLQQKVEAFSINAADDLGIPNLTNDHDEVIIIKDPDGEA